MKGVIVAAGYGTRFMPLTKTLPKEMLPLFDKPLIDFILDEFEEAGIKDVIIITSRRKKVLEDYLDREVELESVFEKEKKLHLLEKIRPRQMNFYFVRQQEMKGTGHALLLVRSLIQNDPFMVAYPDDIVLSKPGLTKIMCDIYRKTGKNILAVRVEKENVSRYGVVQCKDIESYTQITKIIEKPSKEEAPSNYVSIGRYLLLPEIFDLLEEGFKKHKHGEYYHIDSINSLAAKGKVLAHEIDGIMLDTGEPYSYLLSWLTYIQKHPEGSKILHSFLKNC